MTGIDLSALRRDEPPQTLPRRPLGPRLLALGVLALAFAVLASFVWPLLRPPRAVPTAAVRAAGAAGPAATAIAEAAGWIEPDPFPTVVRPLVDGRVEELLVLEGAGVRKDETVIARLASAAIAAQRDRATAVLAEREGALALAEAKHRLAAEQLAQKAEPRSALADAELALHEREAKLAAARGAADRAAAELAGAVAARTAQEQLEQAGGTYAVALARVRAAAAAAEAAATASARELEAAERELAATRARLEVARDVAERPVDLQGALAVAAAEAAAARAARDAAATERQIAEREASWLEVKAPVDGVVMKLLAQPGGTVGPEGDGLVALYDPARLRARIDVPLGAVGAIRDGQEVELRSEVLGAAVVRGVVQRVQHESDLLKNTLQVKVRVLDPPALLRPETLCRARFLGGEAAAAAAPMLFLVPKAAVRGDAVFVLDPARRAARRIPVETVGHDRDAVLVRGELSITQRVILTPVDDGESVREESL